MKRIDCPMIGRRAVSEFTISGVLTPEPEDLGDFSPGRWVYERESVPMRRTEWWFHGATQLWFTVVRDTATDDIIEVKAARG